MAFLGGGSIAAGGFGAAGGAIVLSGGAAIIAISTGILGHYAFKMYDQKQENDKIEKTMNYFKEFAFFEKDSTEEFISNPNLIKNEECFVVIMFFFLMDWLEMRSCCLCSD